MAKELALKEMTSELKLLYAEDDTASREQYATIFRLLFKEVVAVEDGLQALETYKNGEFDLIITDLTMPRMDGLVMIKEIRNIKPEQPIIVMTAHNTNENLRESIEYQVNGILIKPVMMDKLTELLIRVCRPIYLQKRQLEENCEKKDECKIVAMSESDDYAVCVAVIDKFDFIVEKFGKEFKSAIVNVVLQHLHNFGLDEGNSFKVDDDALVFMISKLYLNEVLQALQNFSENNRSIIVHLSDVKIYITLSYGIVTTKPHQEISNKEDALIDYIEKFIHDIRNNKKSTFVVTMDIELKDIEENNAMHWLSRTLTAVKHESIVPFFQPIYDLKSMKVRSYEVFARIKEGNDYILPKFFIDLSEKAGIIEDISEIVFKKSFEVFSHTDFTFHINVSDTDWRDNVLEHYLDYLCVSYSIKPERIILDIIDYETLKKDSKTTKRILRLKEGGYKISFKEFGTGLINIQVLSTLKPDFIKIDQHLIQSMESDENFRMLILSIVDYAKKVGIKIVLVGVESEEILKVARSIGVNCVQGYLFGRPSEKLVDE